MTFIDQSPNKYARWERKKGGPKPAPLETRYFPIAYKLRHVQNSTIRVARATVAPNQTLPRLLAAAVRSPHALPCLSLGRFRCIAARGPAVRTGLRLLLPGCLVAGL